MKVVADLEVHSKYSRAVSPSMDVPTIATWADKKGIKLVGTGDFTHPIWLRELEANLEEEYNGIFKLRASGNRNIKARFMLTSEVSCIYKDRGKGRRVHLLVFLPSFSSVRKFNGQLTKMGANLFSDGRPIIGLTLAQVAQTALDVDSKALLIPAHVWTPWFGFYGNMSGYDSLFEAFGNLEKQIPAIETGLSSDPAMNWRIRELTAKQIVSFGDAHSPQKLGREATVFKVGKLSYSTIARAIWGKSLDKIAYTIEFYPEEGKYHYTGHRKCAIVYSPNEARKKGLACPVCGKSMTVGVMSRVESLAGQESHVSSEKDNLGVRWIKDEKGIRSRYVMLVPLMEIIAECLQLGVGSKAVLNLYENLINKFENEFAVLLKVNTSDIKRVAGLKVSEAIKKVRLGDIFIKPGFDGVFGTVKIWKNEAKEGVVNSQATLF